MKYKILSGIVALALTMGLTASSSLICADAVFADGDIANTMNDQSPTTGEGQSDDAQPGDSEQPSPETPAPENPEPENPQPETPEPENPNPETPQPEDPTPDEPTQPETGFNDPANQVAGSGSGTNSGNVNVSNSSSSSNTITEGSTTSHPTGQALSQIHVPGNSYTTNSEANIDAIDETTERDGVEMPKAETDEDSIDVPNTGSEGGVNFLALGLMMIAGITIVAAGVAVVTLNILAKNAEKE